MHCRLRNTSSVGKCSRLTTPGQSTYPDELTAQSRVLVGLSPIRNRQSGNYYLINIADLAQFDRICESPWGDLLLAIVINRIITRLKTNQPDVFRSRFFLALDDLEELFSKPALSAPSLTSLAGSHLVSSTPIASPDAVRQRTARRTLGPDMAAV